MTDMRGFFEPRGVVVVGVSERPGNLARAIVANLDAFGFDGAVHLVGTRPGRLGDRPIHGDLAEVPDPADLAVILAPAATVPTLVEACGRRGIRRVIIESAGFGESGRGDLAEALAGAARRHGIRFLGPNGLGVMSLPRGLAVPFAPLEPGLPRGGVSILAQSGGVGIAWLSRLAREGLGICRWASMGNKLDVDEADLLEFLLADDATSVVVCYLEGFTDGRRFLDLLRTARKPVIVQKANRGTLARSIAASHTAALAGDDAVTDAALRQGGAVRVHDVHGMLNAVRAFSGPRPRGRRLAVLSRSGGHAVQTADACEERGFDLVAFPPDLLAEVAEASRAGVVRPVSPLDLGDVFDFRRYGDWAARTLARDDVDALLFLHTYSPVNERETSRALLGALADLERSGGKPLAICAVTTPDEALALAGRLGVPVYEEPRDAVAALALARDWRPGDGAAPAPAPEPLPEAAVAILDRCAVEGRDPLAHEAGALLGALGVPTPAAREAGTPDEAAEAARDLGVPVVLKALATGLSHKSDRGGVALDLGDAEAVWAAANAMQAALPGAALLVQAMAPPGLELILGARRDPAFGLVLLAGWGGRQVEVLGSWALRVGPLTRPEVEALLAEIPGARLLDGGRGEPARDRSGAVDVLLALQRLLEADPRVAEAEVNPWRPGPTGTGGLALDVRVGLLRR